MTKKAGKKPQVKKTTPQRGTSKKGDEKVIASTERIIKRRNVKFPGGPNRKRVPEEIWFSQNLKYIRVHKLGWDQGDMAELLEMSQPSYSNMENNRRSNKLNTMSRAAQRINVKLHELLMEPVEFIEMTKSKHIVISRPKKKGT